ncbi:MULTISPECIES: cupin domain-containing protein [Kordiimonas]|jgi:hypothetical protein|uniref:DUF985 domain-containing protein n=1 Tax=Kordiimonas lacus TaxID=637679 RepID=A0A1G7D4Z9_9PROT|nr:MULTISPECIES: cupin domain-containing protein [Kordiimonas]SDE46100.1 hypothetical protein SAMN04488071_2942 [Kordiimonas lacus]
MTTAQEIVEKLDLAPHPEGGYYRRTYRHEDGVSGRAFASSIYYLIEQKSFALWHRVDADELWFWHAGAPAVIETGADTKADETHTMSMDLAAGHKPQLVIHGNTWQRIRSTGDWTLFSSVVSPEFTFETLDLHIEGRPADT